jgi:programmed cell death 6-interacting protein
MLSIPFRRTTAVSLAEPIKQYISNKYDQHPSMFADDCLAIDNTRTAAIQVTDAHVSGIKKLQAYAAQLVWMTAKFPLDVSENTLWLGTVLSLDIDWH